MRIAFDHARTGRFQLHDHYQDYRWDGGFAWRRQQHSACEALLQGPEDEDGYRGYHDYSRLRCADDYDDQQPVEDRYRSEPQRRWRRRAEQHVQIGRAHV